MPCSARRLAATPSTASSVGQASVVKAGCGVAMHARLAANPPILHMASAVQGPPPALAALRRCFGGRARQPPPRACCARPLPPADPSATAPPPSPPRTCPHSMPQGRAHERIGRARRGCGHPSSAARVPRRPHRRLHHVSCSRPWLRRACAAASSRRRAVGAACVAGWEAWPRAVVPVARHLPAGGSRSPSPSTPSRLHPCSHQPSLDVFEVRALAWAPPPPPRPPPPRGAACTHSSGRRRPPRTLDTEQLCCGEQLSQSRTHAVTHTFDHCRRPCRPCRLCRLCRRRCRPLTSCCCCCGEGPPPFAAAWPSWCPTSRRSSERRLGALGQLYCPCQCNCIARQQQPRAQACACPAGPLPPLLAPCRGSLQIDATRAPAAPAMVTHKTSRCGAGEWRLSSRASTQPPVSGCPAASAACCQAPAPAPSRRSPAPPGPLLPALLAPPSCPATGCWRQPRPTRRGGGAPPAAGHPCRRPPCALGLGASALG